MRPNLMSPRRATSGEDSILAMLEREPARKRSAGASNLRLACYGVGALMALGLTGALVWLAANNDGARPDMHDSVLAQAGEASRAAPAAPALIQVAMAPAAPPAEQRSPAVIVDQPSAPEAVPPLRLLKPAPDKAAPPVRVPVPAAAPPRPAARTAAPPRPVAASAAARSAAPAPRPKPVLVAKSATKPGTPKAPRSAPPAARNGEAAVDADVALISAVIVHANGHAPQNSQMTELLCPNDNCQPRAPRQ